MLRERAIHMFFFENARAKNNNIFLRTLDAYINKYIYV